mmetsp:Transcript_99079/g.222005  ORF Transcript_99079/g.222005 Transcript_99079/m.222005 type:complete len:285 (-) Transcript_99079:4167-5021(-)
MEHEAQHLVALPPCEHADVLVPPRIVLAATRDAEGEQWHVALVTIDPDSGVEREASREGLVQPRRAHLVHIEEGEVRAWDELATCVGPLRRGHAETRTPVASNSLALLEDTAQAAAHCCRRGHHGVRGVRVVVAAVGHAMDPDVTRHHALRADLHLGQDGASAGRLLDHGFELRVPHTHRHEGGEGRVHRTTVFQQMAALRCGPCCEHREVAQAHCIRVGGLQIVATLLCLDDQLGDAEEGRLAKPALEGDQLVPVKNAVGVAVRVNQVHEHAHLLLVQQLQPG